MVMHSGIFKYPFIESLMGFDSALMHCGGGQPMLVLIMTFLFSACQDNTQVKAKGRSLYL